MDVPTDNTVPLATISDFVTEQELEARLIKAIVERVDEQCVLICVAKNKQMVTMRSGTNDAGPEPDQP